MSLKLGTSSLIIGKRVKLIVETLMVLDTVDFDCQVALFGTSEIEKVPESNQFNMSINKQADH